MAKKKCTPITISTCPPTATCDSCLEIISSDCIDWSGSGPVPQACVKLKLAGSDYSDYNIWGYVREFDSCSSDNLPNGCTRSYKIFNNWEEELWSGTSLTLAKEFAIDPDNLYFGLGYTIVEYITCESGSTESLNICFEVRGIGGIPDRELMDSCKCCQDVVVTYLPATLTPMLCEECITINFEDYITDIGNVTPYSVVIQNETNCTVTYSAGLTAELCVDAGLNGTASFEYKLYDIYGKALGNFKTIQVSVSCI